MIRIHQVTLPVEHGPKLLRKKAAKLLRVSEEEIAELIIVRRSVDARKKEQLLYSYILDVKLMDAQQEAKAVRRANSVNIRVEREALHCFLPFGSEPLRERPVIIGAGPAGLFAALSLAENGYRPLLLEQGEPVEARVKRVEAFWNGGEKNLDLHSNVQFGEGGAGTFSDGKLNTMIKDPTGRGKCVLRVFVEAGADSSILWDAKPHIGTDALRTVIPNLRARIRNAGGEVRFGACVRELLLEDGNVQGVVLADKTVISTQTVILAVGHSARELFAVLKRQGVSMEPKAFAVGLRIQHPQTQINLQQYGRKDAGALGAAPYKVTAKTEGGRGVYSFCMCPGGFVVNASSESGRLTVNGMSHFNRAAKNANSAIIVTVTPKDFPEPGPLGGVEFQRRLEEKAFSLGDGRIPIQLYGDFAAHTRSSAFGDVEPQFCGGYAFADLRELMPKELNRAFLEGMGQFARALPGFDRPDAILAGIESRTSSPLRIVRNERMESNIRGLFPCGEGAGYAGGITSAAIDGIKTAEEIIRRFAPVG
ncbi:MAG: FAD-binding protein [Lachnospiraceae bacterium]|nr:FAD-binding protein [Lachnospiraceae bacterium]